MVRPCPFDLETGRLCVMESRHKCALVLVSRDHVPATLEGYFPSAEQAVGAAGPLGPRAPAESELLAGPGRSGCRDRLLTRGWRARPALSGTEGSSGAGRPWCSPGRKSVGRIEDPVTGIDLTAPLLAGRAGARR